MWLKLGDGLPRNKDVQNIFASILIWCEVAAAAKKQVLILATAPLFPVLFWIHFKKQSQQALSLSSTLNGDGMQWGFFEQY